MITFHSFLWLCLCRYTRFSLSTHQLVDTWVVSIVGLMNRAAINMECRCLFDILTSFPLDIHPFLEFLDHIVVLFFFRNLDIVSIMMILIYFSTNNVQRFLFLHILTNTWHFFFLSFDKSHSYWSKVIVVLICISLIINVVERFWIPIGYLYIFF
jgi:hypothetical protein